MGNEIKNKILVQNGIITQDQARPQSSVKSCPRCEFVNAYHNPYCSKCSYPLVLSAFEEIKAQEDKKLNDLKHSYENDMKSIRDSMKEQFTKIFAMIQQNPKLSQVKPEILLNNE
jgi:hypothetical protein